MLPEKTLKREKAILHIDGDAFFVGVEVAKNPKLRGLPVVTGEERGIVTALSYEAKALGVVRGMPVFRLKKNFPQVIILPGDYAAYVKYSGKMFEIVRRYADDVEEYSIDECFADLTALDLPLKMSYRQIAERIKKEIGAELGLSVSIGIAPSKVLAKVASKFVKPNGLTVITKSAATEFLAKTKIEKIWGIGPRTAEKMQKMGILTALDFISQDSKFVAQKFSKPYETLWRELRGESIMKIDPNAKTVYASIQKTRSFHPATNDKIFLQSQISKHIEAACAKARHFFLVPKKVTFFLKTKDFKIHDFTITLRNPTSAPEILIEVAEENFKSLFKRGVVYRTTGVILQDLIAENSVPVDLFNSGSRSKRFEMIHRQIDNLEDKLGKRVVYLASTHKAVNASKKGTDSEDMDRNLLFL